MRVLVAEDDPHIREGLVQILEDEGYEVVTAEDGEQAMEQFLRVRPDFLCLDVMMPGMSGYDVCRKIRAQDEGVPIIFISAKSEEIDRVLGLELGADDFIVKPFGVREVVARIRAVSRRCLGRADRADGPDNRKFRLGDLEVSPSELRARRGEKVVDLSIREVKILRLLSEHPGEVVTRQQFFEGCWGLDHIPNSRTLDQQISQLRKRIEAAPKHPRIILTVHGAGYRYDPETIDDGDLEA